MDSWIQYVGHNHHSFSEGEGMRNQTADAEWKSLVNYLKALHIWKESWGNQPKTQWYRKQSHIYSMGGLVAHGSEISTLGRAITGSRNNFDMKLWSPTWRNWAEHAPLEWVFTGHISKTKTGRWSEPSSSSLSTHSSCLLSAHCVPGTGDDCVTKMDTVHASVELITQQTPEIIHIVMRQTDGVVIAQNVYHYQEQMPNHMENRVEKVPMNPVYQYKSWA